MTPRIPASPGSDWGDRLYAVYAEQRTSRVGAQVWAGVGWITEPLTGRGLFVEHEGDDERTVRGQIAHSLADLPPPGHRVRSTPQPRHRGHLHRAPDMCAGRVRVRGGDMIPSDPDQPTPTVETIDGGAPMNGGLGVVALASLAFAAGGAVMKVSDGFARLWPSLAVAALFVAGAALLARAVRTDQLATVYLIGLGLEAMITVALGMVVFGEHLTGPTSADSHSSPPGSQPSASADHQRRCPETHQERLAPTSTKLADSNAPRSGR